MRDFTKLILIVIIIFLIGCDNNPIKNDSYKITFLDYYGNIYIEIEVKEDEDFQIPVLDDLKGYKFIGWDQDLSNISKDIIVKPIYEKIINYYKVSFESDGKVIKEEIVEEGKSAIAPEVEKIGFKLIGWDKEFNNITSDLTVNAIWERLMGSSYVSKFNFSNIASYDILLSRINLETDVTFTISNIKNGGFRGTNELVYYNNQINFNTNIYGFEVAVNQNHIVIDKATKVKMPTNGFVLSAHGTSISKLEKINIGDVIYFDNGIAKVYQKSEINNPINIWIEINKVIEEVYFANDNYLALDYILIEDEINKVIDIYNSLLIKYDSIKYNEAVQILLNLSFMLIEPTPVIVRAIWHYPTKASGYPENSTNEVKRFLEKIKYEGINRVYLNTNFNGRAIYKSEYLQTSLTSSYKYDGYSDYLQCFIEEAHKLGIEVYAWTNTLIAGDGSNNPFYSSRGWVLLGYNGENNHGGMYFVDISNDDLRNFLSDVYYELGKKYKLDGVEFDFIRYPNSNLHTFNSDVITNPSTITDWGYTESFITKFKTEYNLTGDFKELIRTSKSIRDLFATYKMNLLTDTVEMLVSSIKQGNPNVKISAAVMPTPSGAKQTYLQDYITWIEKGYVDVLEPMIYTADNDYLRTTMINLINIVSGRAEIVAGIFPEGSGGLSALNAKQIIILQELNLGFSKFSSKTIFSSKLKDALHYMNRDYIVLSSSSEEEIFKAYITDLKEKLANYYIPKENEIALTELLECIVNIKAFDNISDYLGLINEQIGKINNTILKNKMQGELLKISNLLKI